MKRFLRYSPFVLLLVGCPKPAPTDHKPTPTQYASQIVEVSGGKQLGGVGSTLPDPVAIQVNGADGNGLTGVAVRFHGEGLKFNPAEAISDSSGQATTAVRLGSAPGDYQVVAEAPKAGGGTVQANLREIALGYEQKLGKELNEKYCIRCHDPESTTERVSNFDNLSPKPHPFNDGAALNSLTDSDLAKIISGGGGAVGKSPQMPAWGATLKPSELKALIAYIRAIADPPYETIGANQGKEQSAAPVGQPLIHWQRPRDLASTQAHPACLAGPVIRITARCDAPMRK
jgi:mono/diheme cytochrome c family protein